MRADLIAQSRQTFWYVAELLPASGSTNASDAFWYDAEAEEFRFKSDSVFLCDETTFRDESGRNRTQESCTTGPGRILCEPDSGSGRLFAKTPDVELEARLDLEFETANRLGIALEAAPQAAPEAAASDSLSRSTMGLSLLESCAPKALASMRPKMPVAKARELASKLAGVVEFELDIESSIPPKYFVEDADPNFEHGLDHTSGRLKSMEVRNVCTGEKIGAPDPAP